MGVPYQHGCAFQAGRKIGARSLLTALVAELTGSSQEATATIHAGDDAASRLAALLREKGNLSNVEAQAGTGLDAATIRNHLQALVAAGHARTEGQRRGMRYVAVK